MIFIIITQCFLGLLMFYTGMAINVHSDYILRNLRKPSEVVYKIPTGLEQVT